MHLNTWYYRSRSFTSHTFSSQDHFLFLQVGKTALMMAISKNHIECVRALLRVSPTEQLKQKDQVRGGKGSAVIYSHECMDLNDLALMSTRSTHTTFTHRQARRLLTTVCKSTPKWWPCWTRIDSLKLVAPFPAASPLRQHPLDACTAAPPLLAASPTHQWASEDQILAAVLTQAHWDYSLPAFVLRLLRWGTTHRPHLSIPPILM